MWVIYHICPDCESTAYFDNKDPPGVYVFPARHSPILLFRLLSVRYAESKYILGPLSEGMRSIMSDDPGTPINHVL